MSDSNALVEKFRAACAEDETVRERFDADPRGVLAEYGFEIPEGAKCAFVGGDDLVHITLPDGALSDEELAAVSGGTSASTAAAAVTLGGIAALMVLAAQSAVAGASASGSS